MESLSVNDHKSQSFPINLVCGEHRHGCDTSNYTLATSMPHTTSFPVIANVSIDHVYDKLLIGMDVSLLYVRQRGNSHNRE
jgi:hypothetical protein